MSEVKQKRLTFQELLDKAIKADTDECILWPYSNEGTGYGQATYQGKRDKAHRLALLLTTGEPPKDKPFALHKPSICHNRSCFNPKHLYWGDHFENMADKVLDGTSNRGERHGKSKLTEKQVLAIRQDKRAQKIIAEEYGIGQPYVSYIKNNKRWQHIEPSGEVSFG